MKNVWVCTGSCERRVEGKPEEFCSCASHPLGRGWASCESDCAPGNCHMCDQDREFLNA